jgi:hypothetical protein
VSLVRTAVRRDNREVNWSKRTFIMFLSSSISELGDFEYEDCG